MKLLVHEDEFEALIRDLSADDEVDLAVAVRLGVDELITYDRELSSVAAKVGLRVRSPE